MKNTKIHWADHTVNPVAGCDGCELRPPLAHIARAITQAFQERIDSLPENIGNEIRELLESSTELRKVAIQNTVRTINATHELRLSDRQITAIAKYGYNQNRCYAGIMTDNKGGCHPGFPVDFEVAQEFPGRMEDTARCRSRVGVARPRKPWLNGLPTAIFVSDMGML